MVKAKEQGQHVKQLWERPGVKNFPSYCPSWKKFELELHGRQFLFRCLLRPDTQPYCVNYATGDIVPSANPRSKKILTSEMSIRRYKCDHAGWPNNDCHESNQVGCEFFLVAIKPFADEEGVFVQIGSSKGKTFLSRNHVSFHNHHPKALWLREAPSLVLERSRTIIVHQDFFPEHFLSKLTEAVQQLLIRAESRWVHFTQEMLEEIKTIVMHRVNKWEKRLKTDEDPYEWVAEVCLIFLLEFLKKKYI
jgi:hypothetical protein